MGYPNTVPKLKEVKLGGGEFVINDQTTKVPQSFSNLKNTIILTIPERDREFLKIFKWQDEIADEKLREEGYIIDVDNCWKVKKIK